MVICVTFSLDAVWLKLHRFVFQQLVPDVHVLLKSTKKKNKEMHDTEYMCTPVCSAGATIG